MTDMSPDTIAVLDAIPLDALLAYWRKRTTVLSDVPDAALLAEQTRRGNQDVETVEGIATFLGCSAESVVTWSRQNVDPLPHDFDGHGRMTSKRSALAAWWGRRAFHVKAAKWIKRTPPRSEPNATECASAKSRKR